MRLHRSILCISPLSSVSECPSGLVGVECVPSTACVGGASAQCIQCFVKAQQTHSWSSAQFGSTVFLQLVLELDVWLSPKQDRPLLVQAHLPQLLKLHTVQCRPMSSSPEAYGCVLVWSKHCFRVHLGHKLEQHCTCSLRRFFCWGPLHPGSCGSLKWIASLMFPFSVWQHFKFLVGLLINLQAWGVMDYIEWF